MSISVNLIARDNGLGLSRDARLLKRALESLGCAVHLSLLGEAHEQRRWKLGKPWRARLCHAKHALAAHTARPRWDINVMFEHLWPDHLSLARCNVALPNPEWFDGKDLRHLARIDAVWTKTLHAAPPFQAYGCRTAFVGFASEDRLDQSVARTEGFFHLAGGSLTKGTDRLLALWKRHPEWPLLTVVSHKADATSPPNIRLIANYLSDDDLRHLQNSHRFHLCPSETEGYGHYIGEAMSVGAVVIGVDAPPMNELLGANRGLLVPAARDGAMGLATRYLFDPAALEQAVIRASTMGKDEYTSLSLAARAWFDANRLDFPKRISAALHALQA